MKIVLKDGEFSITELSGDELASIRTALFVASVSRDTHPGLKEKFAGLDRKMTIAMTKMRNPYTSR